MDTTRELNYRLYIHRDESFTRQDVRHEFSVYDMIRSGETEMLRRTMEQRKKEFFVGKGVLSDNPLRNMMYHFVVSSAMIARICLDGGMPHEEAYTLSDLYIRKADRMTDPGAILDLLYEMQLDFAERMHERQKPETHYSPYVRHAIDYIYDHLHEKVTLSLLAHREGLNASYFSTLFADEVGIPVKKFILRAKLTTGRRMLENNEFPIASIALSLGFSSQSAFTSAFRDFFGSTPGKYRESFNYTEIRS